MSICARTINRTRLGSAVRAFSVSVDDELHFLAGAFELSWRGKPNDGLSRVRVIFGRTRHDIALPQIGVTVVRLKNPLHEPLCAEVDIDAIEAHLDAHDHRTEDRVPRILSPVVQSPDNFRCRIVRPLLRRRVAPMSGQRFDNGDRIGEERSQTLNDKTFHTGRRNALARRLAVSLFASRPGDEAARHVVPISNALFDRVGRGHGFAVRVDEDPCQKIRRAVVPLLPPLDAVGFEPTLDTRPEILIDD